MHRDHKIQLKPHIDSEASVTKILSTAFMEGNQSPAFTHDNEEKYAAWNL